MSCIVRVVISKRLRWAGYMTGMGKQDKSMEF